VDILPFPKKHRKSFAALRVFSEKQGKSLLELRPFSGKQGKSRVELRPFSGKQPDFSECFSMSYVFWGILGVFLTIFSPSSVIPKQPMKRSRQKFKKGRAILKGFSPFRFNKIAVKT
jgi:hypothetical protein